MRRLIVVALLAGGCASGTVWSLPPGRTEADFRRDSYECERDMRQSGYFGSGFIGGYNMARFRAQCMEAKGYERRQAPRSPDRIPDALPTNTTTGCMTCDAVNEPR